MPEHIKEFVKSHGIEQTEYSSIEEVVETADVLYVTRLTERFKQFQRLEPLENRVRCYDF
jgi:aspartate carbamoyltransferase catalytic subunit